MNDGFATSADAVYAPGTASFAIVPSDTTPLPTLPKAIYVGTGGRIAMRGSGDAVPATWLNVPSGSLIPFRAAYVQATGTTAADILGIA
jgi:hypothetical protein